MNFISGKIQHLPWIEGFDEVKTETKCIEGALLKMNMNGLLTTNSQPRVNAAPSTHKVHGWGPAGGYVYQKEYFEFFCPSKLVDLLTATLKNYPSITYQAVNYKDHEIKNFESSSVNAVTWGIFPNEEIQ